MSAALEALLEATRSIVNHAATSAPHADLFAAMRVRLGEPSTRNTPDRRSLPVVDQWLGRAVANATGPWRHVADLVGRTADQLQWCMAYADLPSTPELDSYRDHYSFAALACPIGQRAEPVFVIDDVLVGLSIQAPHVDYPHHHHAPAELYAIISGTAQWQVGDQPWSTKRPGDLIVHRPNESHSMRTTDEPLLALAVWPTDLTADVFMPSMDAERADARPTTYPVS